LLVSLDFFRTAWGDLGTVLMGAAITVFCVLSGIAFLARKAALYRAGHAIFGVLSPTSGVLIAWNGVVTGAWWVALAGVAFVLSGLWYLRAAYKGVYRYPISGG